MTDTTKQFKRQLPRNTLFQVLAFVTQVGAGIWLVPYLVKNIGTAAYGLIPLAGVLTQYASLISQSISSAVARFLTIALQQDDVNEAKTIFNTAFFSYLAIGLIQVPVFAFVIYYADSIIAIPIELYRDAIILLICSAVAFIVNMVGSIFSVPMHANNRLDILRGIDISRYIFRVTGIVFFFVVFNPALRYVGYVDLAISLVLCGTQVAFSRRLEPNMILSWHCIDWRKIQPIVAMGGWLIVNSIGTLLFLQMDIWVCNRFISPEAAGEYAAVLQWSTLIRSSGAIISAMIAPMIVIYYARSEMESLIRLSKVAVRVLSLIMAVPISVLCVFSPALLRSWLGETFTDLAPLVVLMLCHLVINVGVLPILSIQVALNKVRVPALVTFFMGLINLALAIFFVSYFDWGVYGVALAGAIALTTKNALFTPIYSAAILQEPWWTFVKPYLSALVLLMGLSFLGYALTRYTDSSLLSHVVLVSISMGIIGFIVALLFLSPNDRQAMIALLPGRLSPMTASLQMRSGTGRKPGDLV